MNVANQPKVLNHDSLRVNHNWMLCTNFENPLIPHVKLFVVMLH